MRNRLLISMKTTFILCTSSDTNEATHIVSVTQPAIFSLPDFNLVSGCNDSTLRENAISWFENGCKPEVKTVRSQPPGFQEALAKVRQNRDQVNIAELAEAVGLSEKFMTAGIDDVKWKGAVIRIPMSYREKFIEVVSKLRL